MAYTETPIEDETPIEEQPKYWLPDTVYQALKWVGLAALPTLSWGYQALASVWGWPYSNEVSMSVGIVGTLIAALIGASSISAKK